MEINESYLAYLYVVVLQIWITYLQRPDLYRRLHNDKAGVPEWPGYYATATGIIATALNWLSWVLSAYVAKEFGLMQGVLFFVAAIGSSIASNLVIPRVQTLDWYGHMVSVPATVFFLRALLNAVGVQTGI